VQFDIALSIDNKDNMKKTHGSKDQWATIGKSKTTLLNAV